MNGLHWYYWVPGEIVAVTVLITLFYKGLRTFVHFNDALPVMLKAAKELENNGGSSVKDDVQHIKREQASVRRELARTNDRTERRLGRLEHKVGVFESDD